LAGRDFSSFAELFETPLRNGLTKPKAVRGEGMKMVNMGEVFAHRRIHNLDMDRVPMDNRERDSSLLRGGDLLFARQSLVLSGAGKCVLFQGDKEEVTFESHIIRCRLNQRKADPAFYFYLFQSPQGRSLIESIVEQVAAAGIRGSDLGRLAVPVPPLAEQKTIAAVLGALDDKIELNRQMNATLEAMARALFQSWFVDFDPVRAKLDGRKPAGLDEGTAAIFPATFDETELGHIPHGWQIKTIDELAERVAMGPFGSDIKVSTFVPEGIPVVSGQHLRGTLLDDTTFNFVSIEHADRLKRSNVQRGDVIFTHAGSIGQVAYIPDASRYERYIISQRQFYMRCNRTLVSPFYITSYFKTPEGQHRLLANTSSTGVPSISQPVTYLRQLKMVVPPPALLKIFDTTVSQIHLKIADNDRQSRSLATLRDTLLPKLLSGELNVLTTANSKP